MSPDRAARWPVWIRALVGVLATIGAGYIALMLWLSFGPGCSIEDKAVVPSPSGAVVAHVSEIMCRGEMPITEVIVVRSDSHASTASSEVVFRTPAKPNEDGGYSTIHVYLAWPANDELLISYPYAARFDSRVEDAAGVKVSYHEVSPSRP